MWNIPASDHELALMEQEYARFAREQAMIEWAERMEEDA